MLRTWWTILVVKVWRDRASLSDKILISFACEHVEILCYNVEFSKRYINGFRRDFKQPDINEMINWGKANRIKNDVFVQWIDDE